MSEKVERTWLCTCRGCTVRFMTRDRKKMLDDCPVCDTRFVDYERTKVSAFFHSERDARIAGPYLANVTHCTRYYNDEIEFFTLGTSRGVIVDRKTLRPYIHEWVRLVPELRNAYLEGENDEQSDT